MLSRLRPIRKVAIPPPAKSHTSNPITRLAGRRRRSSGLERRSTVATWHPRCRDDRSLSHRAPTIVAIRVKFSWCCHCRVGSQAEFTVLDRGEYADRVDIELVNRLSEQFFRFSICGALPGLGCQAERQRREVGVIGCLPIQGSSVDVGHYKSPSSGRSKRGRR